MFKYNKFQELCEEHKITPYRVSQETGIATSTLTNWKQGEYIPKADKIQKLAEFFEVNIEEFMQ